MTISESCTYQTINNRIILCEIKIGEKLCVSDLMEEFHVSKLEAEDVLHALCVELFLDHIDDECFIVKELSLDEINENFEVRKSLECLAAKMAILNIENSDIEELDRLAHKYRHIENEYEYAIVDQAIHWKIWDMANNKALIKNLRSIELREVRWWYYMNQNGFVKDPFNLIMADSSVLNLINAIKNKDMISSTIAINEHLEYWYRIYNTFIPNKLGATE